MYLLPNAILIVTNAGRHRAQTYRDPFKAAIVGARIRLRPILMTSLAMIAGMVPGGTAAVGLGTGDQSARWGARNRRARASTLAALLIVPLVYGWVQQKRSTSLFLCCLKMILTLNNLNEYEALYHNNHTGRRFIRLFLGTSAEKKAPVKAVIHFNTAAVSATGISTAIRLPAQLAGYQEVSIFPKVNGYVQQVLVDIGSAVHKGQLLMTLEDPELEQVAVQAREKAAHAQAGYMITKDSYYRLLEASAYGRRHITYGPGSGKVQDGRGQRAFATQKKPIGKCRRPCCLTSK